MKARMIVFQSQLERVPDGPLAPLVLIEEDGKVYAASAEHGAAVDAASVEQVTSEFLKRTLGIPRDEAIYLSDEVREVPEGDWLSPEMFLWCQAWWREVAQTVARPALVAA